MNIFDITANRIRQVKDGAVNDIEDLYASKSDIPSVLDLFRRPSRHLHKGADKC